MMVLCLRGLIDSIKSIKLVEFNSRLSSATNDNYDDRNNIKMKKFEIMILFKN